jgi:hypothetical protein
VTIRLAIDRFEGHAAVLLTDDGQTIALPRTLLPKDVRPGDVLVLTLARDAEATARVARDTRAVQDELTRHDPGGDLTL